MKKISQYGFESRSLFIPLVMLSLSLFNSITHATFAQVFPNPADLSTGQGANGTNDPIWLVSNWFNVWPTNTSTLTYNPAYISNNCAPGSWIDPASLAPPLNNGNWVSSSGMPCDGISYAYVAFRLTLDLPSDCNGNSLATAGNYVLSFDGYVDNVLVDVLINGVSENIAGLPGGSYVPGGQVNIVLDGPWAPGTNHVDFIVNNNLGGGGNLSSTGDDDPYGLLLVANSTFGVTNDSDSDGVVDLYDECPCEPGTNQIGCTDPVIVNEYTPVTAFDICTNAVTVGNPSPFNVGDRALLIQMMGASIDLTNTPAFGNITVLGDAGNYEFVEIAAINGNDIQLLNTLVNTYTVSGGVQLITVPQYTDLTVTAPLTCAPWDGQVGGVLVLEASGTVTLLEDIDVTGRGFGFGNVSPTGYNCPGSFDYFYDNASHLGAEKGKGIAVIPLTHNNGMGCSANGGGGGNNVNAGGGGGGNFGAGGKGGNSWEGCPIQDLGGRGGLAMTYSNAANRIFMGGGGGGGQQNNMQATPGTAGGGIILIRSNTIVGNGSSIKAGALDATIGGCDASGGGGAGGTILLDVTTFSGALNINTKGGNGAITSCYAQGASGGGGGGVIWSTNPLPGNVAINVSGGTRGIHGTGSEDGLSGSTLTGLVLEESTVTWSPLATPSFEFNIPCPGDDLMLTGTWSGPPVTFSWTGQAGFTATGQNATVPNVTGTNSGAHTLTVTDAVGCTASFDSVVNVFTPPIISAGPDVSTCPNEAVQLTATGGVSYQWSPTTGLDDATLASPSFTGTTLTTLTVTGTDFNGCTATDDVTVTVLTVPTIAIAVSICDGDVHMLPDGATATNAGFYQSILTGPNGCDSIVNTELTLLPVFNIGVNAEICDGETYALPGGASATTSGTYTDSFLTVMGCDSIITTELVVNPVPLTTVPVSICLGQSYLAEGAEQTMAGTYYDTLSTTFGCDSVLITQLVIEPLIVHTISEAVCPGDSVFTAGYWKSVPATYNDTLQTPFGCDSLVVTELSNHPVPVAAIAVSNSCLDEPLTVTDASTVSTGSIAAWDWQLDNGNTSALQQPAPQTYPSAGMYTIQLIVWTNNGCTDTTSEQVEIYPLPLADFIADSVCFGLPVQFTDQSVAVGPYAVTQWDWVFGDGQTSTQQHPNVLFSDPGPQSAELTVTNSVGCKADTTFSNAMVFPVPVAVIDAPADHCLLDTAFFQQVSTVDEQWGDAIVAWLWDIESGTTSTVQEPWHVFSAYGEHTVSLTVTTANGCSHETTATIEVFARPLAAMAPFPTAGCEPLTVDHIDQSSIAPPYALGTWHWDLGNGTQTGDQFPSVTYDYAGTDAIAADTLQVTLWVESANGCASLDTAMATVVVYPLPTASFDIDPLVADMVNPTITFTDGSTPNVTHWNWTLGDGQQSSQQHPVHVYADTGLYAVMLMVTTQFNCTATMRGEVTITPSFTFYVPNTFTPNSNGRNDLFRGVGEGYTDHRILIFDRWGEQIFEGVGDMGWDGSYRGVPVEVGVYAYLITVKDWTGDERRFAGHVNLVR